MIIKFEHLTSPKHTVEYELAHLRHQSVCEDIWDTMLSSIVSKYNPRDVLQDYYWEHPKMNSFLTKAQYNMIVNAYLTRYNQLFNTNF